MSKNKGITRKDEFSVVKKKGAGVYKTYNPSGRPHPISDIKQADYNVNNKPAFFLCNVRNGAVISKVNPQTLS